MPPTIGKRAKARFQVLECNVRLATKGLLGLIGNQMHCASLINLSTSGMQVISHDMLKLQREYDIGIYTPAFRQPISTKGRIIWQKPYNGKDTTEYYRIGFEFTYFKGNAMERLEELENRPQLREIRRD
jgi:hypothetical protein